MFGTFAFRIATCPTSLAEVMDKMPSLEGEWVRAFVLGSVAFIASRYLKYGVFIAWLTVLLALMWMDPWLFDESIATAAWNEEPRAVRLALLTLVVPLVGVILGVVLRNHADRRASLLRVDISD